MNNSKVPFKLTNRHEMVDDIAEQLQKKISNGEIKEGQKIPTEPQLMEQFGVGRSTIREALRVLVHAGLLEKRQGSGTYVAHNSIMQEPLSHRLRRAEILEVYEVRKMLEIEMSRLAAERRGEDDLEQMRTALDLRLQAIQQGDLEAYAKADLEFHLTIARASKNAVASDLFRSFSSVLADALRKLTKEPNISDRQHPVHENLYQAIKDKNPTDAVYWTEVNLNTTIEELKKFFQHE